MIQLDRLMKDIDEMAKIGALPDGGNTRGAMSPEDLEGRRYLISAMERAGLTTRVDPAGNIFGRREADLPADLPADQSDELPGVEKGAAILLCSHIDTVPAGGPFDGVLGVFGAIECIRTLQERGTRMHRPVEIVAFNDEEERFLGFLGSYAVTGQLSADDLVGVTDSAGVNVTEAMEAAGLDPSRIGEARRNRGSFVACLEVHIEQGPVLDLMKVPVGVVRGVKGDYRRRVTFQGRQDHAGAPKRGRRDAFMAFHWFSSRVITLLDIHGNDETTLTIGRLKVEPNIETIQPGYVEASIDLRSPDPDILRRLEREMYFIADEIESNHGVTVNVTPILTEEPVRFDDTIVETLKETARELGYPFHEMYSGAGHDAQVLAGFCPSGMIFVPSVDGRSHCPQEYTAPDDIEKGINLLYHTLVRLGGSPVQNH
jgi:beta-ureidopropionase / N-carbamoyl-L-amino-acid hydrolase